MTIVTVGVVLVKVVSPIGSWKDIYHGERDRKKK